MCGAVALWSSIQISFRLVAYRSAGTGRSTGGKKTGHLLGKWTTQLLEDHKLENLL